VVSARAAALLGAAALASPCSARAQEVPPTEATPAAADPSAADVSTAAEPVDAFRWTRVELHGRVLVRGFTEDEDGASASDVDAENLRVELRWRPARWLRATVEYDQAEDAHLKDAYLALESGRLEVRVGQFKPPVSPIQMESRWDLPAADRGLVSQVLVGSFGIAGRRPGVQLAWDQKGGPWRAAAGVFRASNVRGDRLGDEAFDNLAKDWDAVKATGRLAWRQRRLEVGAAFDLRPAEPVPGEGYSHYWTAGADVTWSARRHGPRVWAEGYLGSSWQDADPFDGDPATFLAGRVLAGWRFGSGKARDLAAEPYAAASVFDPDASVRDDILWELAGGVRLGGFRHLRLVIEAQHRGVGRNAPLSLGVLPFGGRPPSSRTRLVAQVGAAF
jgi:hypothetical protein